MRLKLLRKELIVELSKATRREDRSS